MFLNNYFCRSDFENLTGEKLAGEKLYKDLSLRRDPSKPISPLSEFASSSKIDFPTQSFFDKSHASSLSPSSSHSTIIRPKSESPASSISSSAPNLTTQDSSSQQSRSIWNQQGTKSNQPTTTSYGFQLSQDQGKTILHKVIGRRNTKLLQLNGYAN